MAVRQFDKKTTDVARLPIKPLLNRGLRNTQPSQHIPAGYESVGGEIPYGVDQILRRLETEYHLPFTALDTAILKHITIRIQESRPTLLHSPLLSEYDPLGPRTRQRRRCKQKDPTVKVFTDRC